MTKFKDLKVGDPLSETSYYIVEKIKGNQVQLKHHSSGESVILDEKYVNSFVSSADQFTSTVELNRTDLAKKFIESANVALTVTFQKQVKDKDVISELTALYPNAGKIVAKANYDKAVKAAIKKALEGETRVLKGYHWGEIDSFGRVQMIDLEVTGYGARQCDPRTISELIVKGVKYKVK